MTAPITATRLAALMQARWTGLWRAGAGWSRRGARSQRFDARTVEPMVAAGLLEPDGHRLRITDAGLARIAEAEGRR